MSYFIITLIFMSLALAGMAVGVIISNKRLKGSCGGLGAIMGDDCMFCENKDKCEKEKPHLNNQNKLSPQ
jgi:hypothetical protein